MFCSGCVCRHFAFLIYYTLNFWMATDIKRDSINSCILVCVGLVIRHGCHSASAVSNILSFLSRLHQPLSNKGVPQRGLKQVQDSSVSSELKASSPRTITLFPQAPCLLSPKEQNRIILHFFLLTLYSRSEF